VSPLEGVNTSLLGPCGPHSSGWRYGKRDMRHYS